ncbi:hypothetical protein P186_1856 [Pyrobaculum ferrireducens]|uniref:Uncharacterized protein n=1 Tax=Pyrobaculum ferrireducens TaxID=1104324 RepID=G7VHG9_9CREN|nr:hypothetical protein P186_1856 [Pyrobaculum ferrireducens]
MRPTAVRLSYLIIYSAITRAKSTASPATAVSAHIIMASINPSIIF